jgi:hypothetical protein
VRTALGDGQEGAEQHGIRRYKGVYGVDRELAAPRKRTRRGTDGHLGLANALLDHRTEAFVKWPFGGTGVAQLWHRPSDREASIVAKRLRRHVVHTG